MKPDVVQLFYPKTGLKCYGIHTCNVLSNSLSSYLRFKDYWTVTPWVQNGSEADDGKRRLVATTNLWNLSIFSAFSCWAQELKLIFPLLWQKSLSVSSLGDGVACSLLHIYRNVRGSPVSVWNEVKLSLVDGKQTFLYTILSRFIESFFIQCLLVASLFHPKKPSTVTFLLIILFTAFSSVAFARVIHLCRLFALIP